VVGGCNVIGLTLLVLSAAAGDSAVRAAGDSPTLESIAIEPLTKMVLGLEQRVAAFESSLATFAISFTATRIAARELCVADDSGTQTCNTRAQLDSLLKGAMQTAQAAPAIQATATIEPQLHRANEQSACPEKCVAPAAVATAVPSAAPPAVIATTARPETLVPAEAPGKDDEPAQVGMATDGSALAEPDGALTK
jgi:hypothetical protein